MLGSVTLEGIPTAPARMPVIVAITARWTEDNVVLAAQLIDRSTGSRLAKGLLFALTDRELLEVAEIKADTLEVSLPHGGTLRMTSFVSQGGGNIGIELATHQPAFEHVHGMFYDALE